MKERYRKILIKKLDQYLPSDVVTKIMEAEVKSKHKFYLNMLLSNDNCFFNSAKCENEYWASIIHHSELLFAQDFFICKCLFKKKYSN